MMTMRGAFDHRDTPRMVELGHGVEDLGLSVAAEGRRMFERFAEMQEELLWLCEAAHIPVISATRVLESLVKKGLPMRQE